MTRPTKRAKSRHKTLGEALGAVISDMRIARKWSRQKLAEKVGYSHTQMSNIETSKQSPRYKLIVSLSQAFNLRPSRLIARAEKKYAKLRN